MNATTQSLSINVNVAGFVPVNVTMQPQTSSAAKASKSTQVVVEAQLHRVLLQDLLFKQVGKFVTLDFAKVDGSGRSLNGRLGVKKHLKGGTNKVAANDRPYLVVYDVQAKGYRAVNLATVTQVRAQHTIWTIIG